MSGERYTANCIIDCRVSDPSQLKGGSLDDQEKSCRQIAAKNKWQVVRVFRQPHSATTTEREDIQEKIEFIKDSKVPIHFYLVKKINRFTRAGYPEYVKLKEELEKLGVQLRDSLEVIQPKKNVLEHLGNIEYSWSVYAPSESSEMIAAHDGKQDARNILAQLIGAEITLYQEGYAIGPAPDGMRNVKTFINGRNRTIREANPERVGYFIKMYELAASGIDDESAVSTLNAMGFRTPFFNRYNKKKDKIVGRGGGNPLTVKHYQKHLRTIEYAGVKCGKWSEYEVIRNQYPGIVSIDLFNKANWGKIYIKENVDGTLELLHNYNPARATRKMRNNPMFPHDWILCPLCKELGLNKQFTHGSPRSKSGKQHPTYSCSRNGHYYGVNKIELEETLKKYLGNLKFDQGYLNSLEITFLNKYRERHKEIIDNSAQIHNSIADLKSEQAAKIQAIVITTSSVVRKSLEMEVEELEKKIDEARRERLRIEITESDIKTFIRNAKEMMEHPSKWLLDSTNPTPKGVLFSLVFEEMPSYAELVNGTPKLHWIFNISLESAHAESDLVRRAGFEPA